MRSGVSKGQIVEGIMERVVVGIMRIIMEGIVFTIITIIRDRAIITKARCVNFLQRTVTIISGT